MTLTLGKMRRMQQCATASGHLVIAAMDHRNNLRNTLNADNPTSVAYADLVQFKQQVASTLTPAASAILLDPEFGAGQAVASGAVSGQRGLVVAVEATGYLEASVARKSRILDQWSVEKISRMGASAVKLLIYYHPDAPNAAEQEALVAEVGAACQQYELPFFLEPLSFSLDAGVKKLGSTEKRRVVIETARRLIRYDVDVLKAEFPINWHEEQDRSVWADACAELATVCPIPWVILSAGVDFSEFAEQTEIACKAGASGIMVGRAVWKEAGTLPADQRKQFLQTVGVERMHTLSKICQAHGRTWMSYHPERRSLAYEGWYQA